MERLIECVPNFSEGVNQSIIQQIAAAIEQTEGVHLLDVDPGKATNRTVMTMVGAPEAVIEAAFQAIQKASELIDMRQHTGAHPRMGATDVCPLIPVSGVSMDECAEYARQLGKRVGESLGIPVYLYENAQPNAARKNLSVIRAGEYEGFFKKIKQPEWTPDFGPTEMNARSGATVIGARDFLIAYNVNLNTQSTRLANSVAFDIRENGRVKRSGNPFTGPIEKDADGNEIRIPGLLKSCKAIGWYIDEYKVAQVSINLTNYKVTNVHQAFDACCDSASKRGMRVTGSELVGLIPLEALLAAGKHYLQKQGRSLGVDEETLIHIAVKSLGLDELAPFDPAQKIIEYKLRDIGKEKLVRMSVKGFVNETASESPAPGGGSIAALSGALGAALGTMVANLSAGKRGWEDQLSYFSDWAVKGQHWSAELLRLVDEDTAAFNRIMDAFALAKGTEEEKSIRKQAIQDATLGAVQIPFRVMEVAHEAFALAEAMVEKGNPNSVTDAGVGSLALLTAVKGAWLNVLVNLQGLDDASIVADYKAKGSPLVEQAEARNQAIWHTILTSLNPA